MFFIKTYCLAIFFLGCLRTGQWPPTCRGAMDEGLGGRSWPLPMSHQDRPPETSPGDLDIDFDFFSIFLKFEHIPSKQKHKISHIFRNSIGYFNII